MNQTEQWYCRVQTLRGEDLLHPSSTALVYNSVTSGFSVLFSCLPRFFLSFLKVLLKQKDKKKEESFNYLKNVLRQKSFVIILIYYCVPIVNMKRSYFASQGPTLYYCYI
ncbi:hypothetical protein GDO86_003269 [Hymenochirus boettgeri]|uniref:Uncharacterized protein n=1 Tax=Hymenochirus boettgeri TaxID=247094 RepID=A0A8T2K8S9_9PIPI|nr:hypothetical protein GDO86_003269 [Hymenochirus boettgeri]